MKKIGSFLLAIFLVLPMTGKALEEPITSYHETLQVTDEKQVLVSETYSFTFPSTTTSWVRTLPLNQTFRLGTETVSLNRIITGVGGDQSVTPTEQGNQLEVALTDSTLPDRLFLNYMYSINGGTVYLPLLDGDFASPIDDVLFTVLLPKELDASRISLLPTDQEEYSLRVDGTRLLIERTKVGSATTLFLKLDFPSNYFAAPVLPPDPEEPKVKEVLPFPYFVLIAPILGALAAFVFWLKYARGNKILGEDTIHPPEDLDSVEVGFLYKGYIKQEDIMSLILYLATNGYLRIVENPDGQSELENSIELVKLKDYTENNSAQHTIFEALFEEGDRVKISNLTGTLSDDAVRIIHTVNNDYNRRTIYQKEVPMIKLVLGIVFALSIGLTSYFGIYTTSNQIWLTILVMLLLIASGFLLFVPFLSRVQRLCTGIPLALIGIYFTLAGYYGDWTSFGLSALGIVLSFVIAFIWGILPLRTRYGNEMLGRIYSFRQALLKMVPKQLEEVSEEEPEYFYNMLPYAMSLGVMEQWLQNEVSVPPRWYETYQMFDQKAFQIFLKNFQYQLRTALKEEESTPEKVIPDAGISTILEKNINGSEEEPDVSLPNENSIE